MAVELGSAAYFLPEEISALASGEYSKSKQAIDFIRATSAMGRTGGFAGNDLRRAFGYGGKGIGGNFDPVPEWMSQYGVTPDEAVASVQRFGIRPTTTNQAVGIAAQLAEMPFRPALSGLSSGELQGSAAMAARYGRIDADSMGIMKFAQQLEPIFARATATGVDQSTLLRSMNTYLSGNASAGGVINTPSIGDFLSSFSSIPGGGTGELGLSMASGIGRSGAMIGRAPLQTILSSTVTSKFKSEEDIKNWLNKTQPGFYESLKNDPAHSAMLDAVVQSIQPGGGLSYTGNTLFGRLLTGANPDKPNAPDALVAMMSTLPTGGLDASGRLISLGYMTGMGPEGVAARDVQTQQQRLTQGPVLQKGRDLAARLMKDIPGLTPQGAAAVVGNFMQESSLIGGELKNGDVGYASWHKTRADQFRAFMRAHPNLSPDEASTQFFEQEIQQRQYVDVLKMLKDPNATLNQNVEGFSDTYEGPGNPRMDKRKNNAASVMTRMAGPRAADAVNNDEDLRRALITNTALGGIIPLRTSGDVMGRNYETAATALRGAAAALDALRNGSDMQNNMLNSGPMGFPQ